MESREQIIQKIKAIQEKIKKDKETGKKKFELALEKLNESREQTELIRGMRLDEALEGMEGELPDEARKLAAESVKLENQLLELENSVKRSQENDSLVVKAQNDLQEQLKEILGVENDEEILKEVQKLGEVAGNIQALKSKLAEKEEEPSESRSDEKSEIEEEVKSLNQRIEKIAAEVKGKGDKKFYIIATLHNTLWRLLADGNNEDFYVAHARSAVWQARAIGAPQPQFEAEELNNSEFISDPRNFD